MKHLPALAHVPGTKGAIAGLFSVPLLSPLASRASPCEHDEHGKALGAMVAALDFQHIRLL